MNISKGNINFKAYRYNADINGKLLSICKPIFEQVGIGTFAYFRFYLDNRYLALCTDKDWLEFCVTEIQHNDTVLGREIKNALERDYHSLLWPRVQTDKLMQGLYNFDIWHGLSVFKRFPSYIELWGFASSKEKDLSNFYLNNFSYITDFIASFNLQAEGIIKAASKYAVATYTEQGTSNHYISDHKLEKMEAEFHRLTPITKIPMINNGKEVFVSPRQMEVLRLLSKGHSYKAIAAQMNIAPKVAEQYADKLKKKLQCRDKATLVEVYHYNKKHWWVFE